MKRKRRQSPKRDEIVQYAMAPEMWNYYFGFRVSDGSRFDHGPYSGFSTLTLEGKLIAPEGLKYPRMRMTLSASKELLRDKVAEPATSIGMLSAQGNVIDAYIFIPAESMAELTSVAHSGCLKVATVNGTRLRWRSAVAKSVSISTEYDSDDH